MKLRNKIFASLCAAAILFTGSPTEAKLVTNKLPLLTYAETPVSVYDTPNGNKKGTIAAGSSLVLVKVIRPDGWAYGSYKVGNRKKRSYRWFRMDELQGYSEFENYIDKAINDSDAYRTRSTYNLVGKVASDEDLIVVAKRGDKVKVIFKAEGNFYRMGWVDKTILSKTANSYSNSTNTNSDDLITDNNTMNDDLLTNTSTDNGEPLSNDSGDDENLSNEDELSEEEGGGDGLATENDNPPPELNNNLPDNFNDTPPDELNNAPADELNNNPPPELNNAPPPELKKSTPNENSLDDSNDEDDLSEDDESSLEDENFSDDNSLENISLPVDTNTNSPSGDVNGDGRVDALDIVLLQKHLKDKSTPIMLDSADINGDGFISMLDVNVLLNLLKAAGKGTGDVNGDGKIDSYDVQALSAYLAKQTATLNRANSDLNGDGNIDNEDLEILQEVIAARK